MEKLTDLERENFTRQAEIIHLTLGYHEARLQAGHPFSLGAEIEGYDMKQAQEGALDLHHHLRGKKRTPLDLSTPSSEPSPTERIRRGVLASVWDSFNDVFGLISKEVNPEYLPFLLDPDLSDLFDESSRTGELIERAAEPGVARYVGAHSVHSGFEVGIGMMTALAAVEVGIPKDHPFDAVTLARIIAKQKSGGLVIAKDEFGVVFKAFPNMIRDFLDGTSAVGIAEDRLQGLLDLQGSGCPALRPMGETARILLKRHDLYRPELDGPPAIKILGTKIRSYLHDCFENLRMTMDFQDSARLPEFDRRVVDRRIV